MRIEVELIAHIQRFAPEEGKNVFDMELDEGATVGTVAAKLGIPETEARLSLVNGRHCQDDRELNDGDTVVLLTPVEGG